MALKLMYITNDPDTAVIAYKAGVDRIFVDLECIGKDQRQRGLNTAVNHHTVEDIRRIRGAVSSAELMVRVNSMHDGSQKEINDVIAAGADVVMLPYFKEPREVASFLEMVDGRALTFPLLETPEAVERLDEILALDGIDEIHIGLNDLSLGYGMSFLFELLAGGQVERLCARLKEKGIPYGFGGIAAPGQGMVPAEKIIREHYRYGSTRVILSRTFCDTHIVTDRKEIRDRFIRGIREIRAAEADCLGRDEEFFTENHDEIVRAVNAITGNTYRTRADG